MNAMSVRQPAMVRFDDDIKHNMMVNIARLYYLKRMTHQQIGQKLGLSRVKVTRLLKEVVESISDKRSSSERAKCEEGDPMVG